MQDRFRTPLGFARILGIAMVVLLLAVLATVAVAATALPGCQGCHYKRKAFATATASASHAKTSCAACHVAQKDPLARGKFGVYEVFGMWVRGLDPKATDATQTRDEYCLACHARVQRGVTTANGMRIAHATCAVGRRCTDCHSSVGHGSATPWPRSASMNDCVSCHREKGASLECATCHEAKLERADFLKSEFSVTHGPNWQKTHGMGDMGTCATCHKSDSCARCHGPGVPHASGFIKTHGTTSLEAGSRCSMCHDKKTFCTGCHGLEMPHPKSFASAHPKVVEESGREQCMRCHAKSDCDTCHTKHVHPGGAVGNLPATVKP